MADLLAIAAAPHYLTGMLRTNSVPNGNWTMRAGRYGILPIMLLAMNGCATPTTEVQPTTSEAVYTASGRYPAAHSGILIAQNAALRDGREMCEQQGKRFRPLGSIAGEDPATGEAVYAVRFRCLARPGNTPPIVAPLPEREPSTDGRM